MTSKATTSKATQDALQQYATGRIAWQDLLARLHGAVASGSNTQDQVLAALDRAVREGTLSGDLAASLKAGIARAAEDPGAADDATRIKPIETHASPPDAARVPTADATAPGARSPRIAGTPVTGTEPPATGSVSPRLAPDATPARPIAAGTTLSNRFTLEAELGHGGMGTVFRALDTRRQEAGDSNPYVAVKVLSEEFKRHPQSLVALQREAGKAQSLAHPNIITVHDFDRDGQTVYMWMELLDGIPLDQTMRESAAQGGLPMQKVLPIVRGIGNALVYAHERGIIHSDLKPSNVFVTRQGVVKVLDFGIARAAWSPDQLDKQDTLFDARELGAMTPTYASPEMLLDLDPHAGDDIYALACVTYELLAGEHPFKRTPAHLAMHARMRAAPIPGVKRRQMKAIEHGLAFARGQRTPSVSDFLREIEDAEPGLARFAGAVTLRRAAAAAGVFTLAAVGTVGYRMSQECARIDEAFLASLQAGGGRLPVDPASNEYDTLTSDYRTNVALGRLLLDQSGTEFEHANLLADNPTTAYGAFRAALAIDGESTEAAEGVLEIVERYAREAASLLAAGNVAEAAEIARVALAVHPEHCALNETLRSAEQGAE